jgi:TolB protein
MEWRGALAALALLALVPGGCSDDHQPSVPFDSDPAVSPDGTAVVFSRYRDGDADIYIVRRGQAPRRLTHSKEEDEWPSWSPDGSKVVFMRSGPSDPFAAGALYVVSAEGSGLAKLTRGGRLSAPAWSPDGKTIAFGTSLDNEIRVVSLGARTATRGRLLIPNGDFPTWSPDGSKLALVRDDDSLVVADLDRHTARLIVYAPMPFLRRPAWSRDGTMIAYAAVPDDDPGAETWAELSEHQEIYVVDVDGNHRRRLTTDDVDDWSPAWTPDGRIVFAHGADLYTMKADGTDSHRLFDKD